MTSQNFFNRAYAPLRLASPALCIPCPAFRAGVVDRKAAGLGLLQPFTLLCELARRRTGKDTLCQTPMLSKLPMRLPASLFAWKARRASASTLHCRATILSTAKSSLLHVTRNELPWLSSPAACRSRKPKLPDFRPGRLLAKAAGPNLFNHLTYFSITASPATSLDPGSHRLRFILGRLASAGRPIFPDFRLV